MNDDLQLIHRTGVTQVQRRAAWARIVGAWQESDLSASKFARQHGLRVKALFRWQYKLRPQPPVAPVLDEVQTSPVSDVPALELCSGHLRVLVHNRCEADFLRPKNGTGPEKRDWDR